MNERGNGLAEFAAWAEAMRGEFEEFLRQTWQALSAARKGCWIADTEEVMRQARDRHSRSRQAALEGSVWTSEPG